MSCLPLPGHNKFYDLNVPYDSVSALNKLTMLVELGYEVVAFSTYMETSLNKPKNFKPFVPDPPKPIEPTPDIKRHLDAHGRTLMQLSRLTIELADVNDLLKVRNAVASERYDVIAVCPMTENFFQQSCTELNVDIITIDCTTLMPFSPQIKLLSCARRRGIYIEICYSPMIRDSSLRVNTIANVTQFSRMRKFENLILSSGCKSPMELRGPYDVANLSCLCGVTESVYLHTVSKHCRDAVVHGFIRKTAKGAIYIQKIDGKGEATPSLKPKIESRKRNIESVEGDAKSSKARKVLDRSVDETSVRTGEEHEKANGDGKLKKSSNKCDKQSKVKKKKKHSDINALLDLNSKSDEKIDQNTKTPKKVKKAVENVEHTKTKPKLKKKKSKLTSNLT